MSSHQLFHSWINGDAGRVVGNPAATDDDISATAITCTGPVDFFIDPKDRRSVAIDDTHWVKLAFEFTDMGFPAVVSVVTQEFSDDANGQKINAETVRLRISRRGNLWALHWADVGTFSQAPWRMLRYFRLGEPGDPVKVGLLTQCPTGTEGSAEFMDIAVGDPPADMRIGQ